MNDSSQGDRRRHLILATSAASLLWAAVPAAQAEEINLIQERGQVSLGTFLNNSDFKIRVDGETTTGDQVDWDNTFGDKDVTRFRLDGLWRISDRHHMRFMYTDYSRTETETIDQEINWQDDVFPVNAEVTGSQGFEIIEAAYEYAFMRSDNYELAGSFGLHWTTLSASLRADVAAPGGGGGTVSIGGPASVDLPLPVIGLRGMWRMGGNFYLDAHAQYFGLEIDNIDGSIINYRAAFIWQPKKYIGVGLGYDNFEIDVDIDKVNFIGSMDWTYSGPQIFYNVSF
jgi:opacity protein-like surface antigen